MNSLKPLTDLGNSERFIAQHKNDLRYCPHLKQWLCWSGTLWEPDGAGQVFQKAKETVKTIEKDVDLAQEDQTLREEIIEHGKRSQSWSRITAMARSASGIAGN